MKEEAALSSDKVRSMDTDRKIKEEILFLFREGDGSELERRGGVVMVERKIRQVRNKEIFGTNEIKIRKVTLLSVLLNQCRDKTVLYLALLSIISVSIGVYECITENKHSYSEGVFILFGILFITIIGSVSEYKKNLATEELEKNIKEVRVKVVRKSRSSPPQPKPNPILSSAIRVGDKVYLEEGDIVPADIILTSSSSLSCNESIITGEESIAQKGNNSPFLISGTTVIKGSGVGLVVAVGEDSFRSRFVRMIEEKPKENFPLKEKVNHLIETLSYLGVAVGCARLGAGLIRIGLGVTSRSGVSCLIESIGLAAVIIPEGVPIALGISSVYASVKMYRSNILVRNIYKNEIMNSITVMCVDKTGTLTENKMKVQEILTANKLLTELDKLDELPNIILAEIVIGILINTTAFIAEDNIYGSKTEIALLNLLVNGKLHKDLSKYKEKTLPFSSYNKYMSTYLSGKKRAFAYEKVRLVVTGNIEGPSEADKIDSKIEIEDKTGELSGAEASEKSSPLIAPIKRRGRVFFKGAPEVIIPYCKHILSAEGVTPLAYTAEEMLSRLSKENRFIALAYREGEELEIESKADCVLVSVISIEDKIRKEVKHCIDTCKRAGIEIKMVTGDGIKTAAEIARQAGIVDDNMNANSKKDSKVFTPQIHSSTTQFIGGKEFRSLEDALALDRLDGLKIFYRFTPEDKLRLIKLLKRKGEVVGVTGDGSNDAPALKHADIGYSMGSGTSIAKSASDIVLLSDSFTSIIVSIKWSRCISDNVKKFCQFQLSLSTSLIVFAVFESIFNLNVLELNSRKIIWINLLADTLCALALSANNPIRSHLAHQAQSRLAHPIITRNIFLFILINSFFQVVFLMYIRFKLTLTSAFTFNTFIFIQAFNLILCNSLRFNIKEMLRYSFSNIFIVLVILLVFIVQLLSLVITPSIFKSDTLSFTLFAISILSSISILVLFYIFNHLLLCLISTNKVAKNNW